MVASCYIILTGTKDNEGAIISRNRSQAANITTISDANWYLVQNNGDHYLGVCGIRCQSARASFDRLTRENATISNVYDQVLTVAPVLNQLSVYSTVMVPKDGLFLAQIVNGTATPVDISRHD